MHLIDRRIRGKQLQRNVARFVFGQIRFECTAAMDRSAIPNQKHLAGNVFFEMLHKRDNAAARKGGFLYREQKSPLRRDRANHRQMLAAEFALQKRRLSFGRTGFGHGGQQIKAAFLYIQESASLIFGFFLARGAFVLSTARSPLRRAGWLLQRAFDGSSRFV